MQVQLCIRERRRLGRVVEEVLIFVWLDELPSNVNCLPAFQYVRYASTRRQRYYQDRYRKGALRRVVAQEHTGLLSTDERESIEGRFAKMAQADDPNILTCTSTLEMGIDIGDLSSTMLWKSSLIGIVANYALS